MELKTNTIQQSDNAYQKKKILFAFVVFTFCLFFNLGNAPIYILDEARNAQCAWEMRQQHQFITPLFNNELRVDKPPFHYFCMMAGYYLFGKTAFAARFFSALCGVFTLLAVYLFTKKQMGKVYASTCVFILGSSTHFIFECRLAVPDPYLIFFQTLTLFSLYHFFKYKNVNWMYGAAFLAAISTLVKGPVALVLPGVVFIFFLVTSNQLRILCTWHLLGSIILYAAVASPWFILVDKSTGGVFTQQFFWEQNLGRFSETMEGHQNFPFLPLVFILAGLLPASVFIFTKKNIYKSIWQNDFTRFSAIVCLVTLVFYSISATILPNYTMVCYPFAAVTIAYIFYQTDTLKRYFLCLLFLYILLGVLALFALNSETTLSANTIYWSAIFTVPILAIFIGIVFLRQNKNAATAVVIGGFVLFNTTALGIAYPSVYKQNPISKNLYLIRKESQFAAFGLYNPAINFYIDNSIKKLEDSSAIMSFIKNNKGCFLIGRESDLNKLDNLPVKIVAKQGDIFELPTTVILQRSDSIFHSDTN